jgi:uncharacterized protein YkwD
VSIAPGTLPGRRWRPGTLRALIVLGASASLAAGLTTLYDQTIGGQRPLLPADEQQVVDQVNAVRAKAGCTPVQVSAELTAMAQLAAQDMVARGYLSSVNPDNHDAATQARSLGYEGRVTESFAAGLATPTEVVTQWTNSDNAFADPVIRRIRTCAMVSIGIGHDTGTVLPDLAPHVWVMALGDR